MVCVNNDNLISQHDSISADSLSATCADSLSTQSIIIKTHWPSNDINSDGNCVRIYQIHVTICYKIANRRWLVFILFYTDSTSEQKSPHFVYSNCLHFHEQCLLSTFCGNDNLLPLCRLLFIPFHTCNAWYLAMLFIHSINIRFNSFISKSVILLPQQVNILFRINQ